MAPTAPLIDDHVSQAQAKKAVDSLLAYAAKARVEKEGTELIEKEENVWLVVATKTIQPAHKLKPTKIALPNPLIDPRTTSICLLVKDPQREYKDLLASSNIKFVSRVVGVEKLRGKFKPFEARRELLKEHGMFLADERIVPLLPKLLGKGWFEAKKQPVPVCMTRKDLKGELERAVSATYMHLTQGTCTSIKLSPLPSHTPSQTLDNLLAAIPQVVSHIKGGWSNIQSLNIKTSTSVSLPIWQCDLGDAAGQRWDGMGEEQWEAANAEPDSESEAEEGGEKKQKKEEVKNGKGKKRSVEESSNEFTASAVVPSPAPSKKAKSPKSSSAAPSTSSPAPSKKSKTAAAAAPSAATPIPAAVKPTKKAGASAPAKEIERKKKSSASAANTAKAGVIGKKGGKKGGK